MIIMVDFRSDDEGEEEDFDEVEIDIPDHLRVRDVFHFPKPLVLPTDTGLLVRVADFNHALERSLLLDHPDLAKKGRVSLFHDQVGRLLKLKVSRQRLDLKEIMNAERTVDFLKELKEKAQKLKSYIHAYEEWKALYAEYSGHGAWNEDMNAEQRASYVDDLRVQFIKMFPHQQDEDDNGLSNYEDVVENLPTRLAMDLDDESVPTIGMAFDFSLVPEDLLPEAREIESLLLTLFPDELGELLATDTDILSLAVRDFLSDRDLPLDPEEVLRVGDTLEGFDQVRQRVQELMPVHQLYERWLDFRTEADFKR